MACTGIEFCKLAIVETKGRAKELTAELERRLPGFDTPLTINVNGCPNSCALPDRRHRVQGDDGRRRGGLPGAPGRPPGLRVLDRAQAARAQVAATDTADYVERVLRGYLEHRTEGETFAAYATRADEEWLR